MPNDVAVLWAEMCVGLNRMVDETHSGVVADYWVSTGGWGVPARWRAVV